MEKNQTKILSAMELHNYVQGYSGVLTPEIIDYLNSLIGLEISALNQEVISEVGMARLYELSLYRKIVIHNIYNRALNVLKNYGNGFNYENSPQGVSIFGTDRSERKYDVFNYWTNENGISNIVLKQTIINPVKRQEQIDRLYKELEEVKASKEIGGVIRRGFLTADKETKIGYINDLIKELESRSGLDGNIEYVTDAQDYFIRQMLGSDGLQVTQDFVERPAFSQSDIAMHSVSLNNYPKEVERDMTKKLVKTYPHTKISKIEKFY